MVNCLPYLLATVAVMSATMTTNTMTVSAQIQQPIDLSLRPTTSYTLSESSTATATDEFMVMYSVDTVTDRIDNRQGLSLAPTPPPSSLKPTISVTLPSDAPSESPSYSPSDAPSDEPSDAPSHVPTAATSNAPSAAPSEFPSAILTVTPSSTSTEVPSESPSQKVSINPTENLSESPSATPSSTLTETPSESPSVGTSSTPTVNPSGSPSVKMSSTPTEYPSESPSVSAHPSLTPSSTPTSIPSEKSSSVPTTNPSFSPSVSSIPSAKPSRSPTEMPLQGPIQTTGLTVTLFGVESIENRPAWEELTSTVFSEFYNEGPDLDDARAVVMITNVTKTMIFVRRRLYRKDNEKRILLSNPSVTVTYVQDLFYGSRDPTSAMTSGQLAKYPLSVVTNRERYVGRLKILNGYEDLTNVSGISHVVPLDPPVKKSPVGATFGILFGVIMVAVALFAFAYHLKHLGESPMKNNDEDGCSLVHSASGTGFDHCSHHSIPLVVDAHNQSAISFDYDYTPFVGGEVGVPSMPFDLLTVDGDAMSTPTAEYNKSVYEDLIDGVEHEGSYT